MITFIQTIVVVVILAVMVMLLISINHLFMGSFDTDQKDVKTLREEVKKKADVVSEHSIFHELFEGRVSKTIQRRL